MNTIKRAVQKSITSTNTPGSLGERKRELGTISNPVKRLSLLALHAAVSRQPECFADLLRLNHQPRNMRHLADGTQSSVYRVGANQVLKINMPSILMSPSERKSFAAKESHTHGLLAEQMGELVLPHTIFIGRHPIRRKESAVQIAQPFVAGFDPELFTQGLPDLNQGNFNRLKEQYPKAVAQLGEFATLNMATFDSYKIIADTNGAGNFVVEETGNTIMVDSTPIGVKHADIQDLIVRQTYNLGLAVAA